jgi:hypothetical protein
MSSGVKLYGFDGTREIAEPAGSLLGRTPVQIGSSTVPLSQAVGTPNAPQVFSVAAGTATVGQTVFTVAPYTPGFSRVTLNGQEIVATATDGNTIALPAGMLATDTLRVFSTQAASAANAVPPTVVAAGGSAARPVVEILGDRRTVRDHGAVLDGTTDDSAAFDAARAAAPAGGCVRVPHGTWKVNTSPTSGPATSVLWQLSGNTTIEGFPIIGIGTDVVESFVEGAKYFARSSSYPNPAPVLRVDATLNHTGGLAGGTSNALQVNMTIPAIQLTNFGWANQTSLISSAYGSGEHVALTAFAKRPSDALSDGHGARTNLWSFYTELRDDTGQPSNVAGALAAYEHDLFCGGDDPGNIRIIHAMGYGRAKPADPIARIGRGSVIGCADSNAGNGGYTDVTTQSYLGRGYSIICAWDSAAFDCSEGYARGGAPAYRMAEAMAVSFAADDKPQLKHTGGALRYYYNGAEIFNAGDTGGFSIQGNLTLQDQQAINFFGNSTSQLKHVAGALRYYWNGAEIINFADNGTVAIAAGLNVGSTLTYTYAHIPDNPVVPTSSADPMGAVGDVIFAGPNMYRKTASGWMRLTFTVF